LKAISHALGNGYILMPEYICDSVLKCFSPEKIVFYKLKDNLQIDANDLFAKINSSTAAVYLMHYFGTLQPMNVLALLCAEKEIYGFKIIEDTTHSIFSQKQTVGDYCVASLRKWFALPNAGVLYSDHDLHLHPDEIRRSVDNDKTYAMMLKTLCLKGVLDCNSVYRKIFNECEARFGTEDEISIISDYSEFLLHCNDVDDSVTKRKFNLNYLKDKLGTIGMKLLCEFTEKDCPFTLPVVVPDRDSFHKYLADNKIYCAIHWPFDGLAANKRPLALTLANTVISLPIDQRYGEEEMAYLFNVIAAYKGRLIF